MTDTKWKTEAKLLEFEELGWDPQDMTWMGPGDEVLDFVVTQ